MCPPFLELPQDNTRKVLGSKSTGMLGQRKNNPQILALHFAKLIPLLVVLFPKFIPLLEVVFAKNTL